MRESLKDFIKRKKEEILVFNKKYKSKTSDINKILQDKKKNYLSYKIESLKQIKNFSNTNCNHKLVLFENFTVNYEYQRYDFDIDYAKFVNDFYNINRDQFGLFFTNCGMSAIYSTFKSLEKLNYEFHTIGNIYVETERMFNEYLKKNISDKKVLFIDTTCFTNIFNLLKHINLSKYEVFVLDTTNYQGELLKEIILYLENFNKTIILIRSHLKLDMLGMEWSTLGSICILDEEKSFINKSFSKEIKIILSIIGGFAKLESIPRYWNNNNKLFHLLNQRVNNIKNNAVFLYEKLKSKIGDDNLVLPEHKLFIIYKLKKEEDYQFINQLIDNFIRSSKYQNIMMSSDSFGFDYFAINLYFVNMSALPAIRISVGDVPLEMCEKIYDEISSFIQFFENME